MTTSIYKSIPFAKAAHDMGDYRLRRLNRIMKKLANIDRNLQHVGNRHTRETKKKLCKKREIKTASMDTVHTQTVVIWNVT
jgi:hypothetical protein